MILKSKFLKWIILVAVIISFTVGITLFTRSQKQPVNNQHSTYLPTPVIPKNYISTPTFILNLDKLNVNLPSSLPTLITTKLEPFSLSEAIQVASQFGFNNEPITGEDIREGTTYIWNEQGASLTIYSKSRKVTYLSNSSFNTINKQLTDDEYTFAANNFINQHLENLPNDYQFLSFSYFQLSADQSRYVSTTREKANIIQVNFSPTVSSYPLLTLNPEKTPITIQVLKDGSILQAELNLLNQITQNQDPVQLKNIDELEVSLNNSVIMTIDQGKINPADLPRDDIDIVEVEEISIAYLVDSFNSSVYQPIYLLKGMVKLRSLSEKRTFTAYLTALK